MSDQERYVWYVEVRSHKSGITKQRVVKETPGKLRLDGLKWGWCERQMWSAEKKRCFETFDDAKKFLLGYLKSDISDVEEVLHQLRAEFGQVLHMKEPMS